MEGSLADILPQIYAYENSIFENIATFIKSVTKLDVYLKDKPTLAPTGDNPYITLRIISSNNSGGWGQDIKIQSDGSMRYYIDNTYQVEIMAYRGRPLPTLNYLLGAFYSFKELSYSIMYSKGVSFLSCSNVTESNSVLDGSQTRLGARMVATFNTRMIIEDAPTTEIVEVKFTAKSYENSYENTPPITLEGDVFFVTT